MNKSAINKLIKEHVDLYYPKRVEQYYHDLKILRLNKLSKYANDILVNNVLMWQDNNETKKLHLTAVEASIYCRKLQLATKRDWRLPEYDELLTLVDYFRYEPAKIDQLHYVEPNRYWTITNDAADVSANWYVDFNYGQTGAALREMKYNIRCVRDMEPEGTMF